MGILEAHAAISLALAAVLWTVQLVVYPAFRFIDPSLFQRWHHGYSAAITWIVAPLILLQTAGVGARFVLISKPDLLWIAECSATLVAWGVTGLISVPIHAKLQKEARITDMQRLVHTNWLRTAAWSLCAACAWIAVRNP